MAIQFKHYPKGSEIGTGQIKFRHFGEEITGEYYLTFSSPSAFALRTNNNLKNWDGALEFSTDTTNWTVWSGTTTLYSVNNVLYLRGTNNTVITGSNVDCKWVMTGSNVSCTGNIENLLDYQTVELGNHPTMADYCYYSMFRGCTSLTSTPNLPATTLANNCYMSTFNGCTSLTEAPTLPAATLTNNCYRSMFSGCTSLTTVPNLPATTLANDCCTNMFLYCTSLTTAPNLPATTLADCCYFNMFYGCTSLINVPNLPATTLAMQCYQNMFCDCISLKVSATQTGTYQYAWRIPTSGTGTIATNWNAYMLDGTGGTFTSDPAIDTTYYVENEPI